MRRALLSLFYVGFLPGPSGTWASAVTAAGLALATGPAYGPTSIAVLAALVAGCVVTLLFAGREGGDDGHGDPGWIVSDEVAGQALATGLAGAVTRGDPWIAAGLAFLGFRVFDILKPGPIGASQRLPGGVGVLVDDLLAGLVAGGLVAGARAAGLLG
ncbi:MAG: phosphatidylglycerophosphatase A [Planctomycetota bacterium]